MADKDQPITRAQQEAWDRSVWNGDRPPDFPPSIHPGNPKRQEPHEPVSEG